jgi:tetratricopeptide repeat protein
MAGHSTRASGGRSVNVAPPKWTPRDYIVALGLLIGFWALYYLSIGAEKPNLSWFNLVFDADPGRVIDDVLKGQNPVVFERHPLFGLVVGTPSRVFGAVLGQRQGVLCATSLLAAIGVATSFLVFRRVVQQRAAAFVFSFLYGLSATLWVIASLPETFAINATIIVAAFVVQTPNFGQPVRHKARFAANVLFAALAIGVAVPNIVYVMLAHANVLRSAQPTLRRRVMVLAFFVASTWATFLVAGSIQAVVASDRAQAPTMWIAPVAAAARDPFLRFDRPIEIREAGQLLRAFALDNVVAPPAVIEAARMADGPLSIIQFESAVTVPYVLALSALVAFVLLIAWRAPVRELIRDHTMQLALVFIAYNIGFHFFYRANGQPFIFSAHTVFPVLFIAARMYARSTFRFRLVALSVATVVVVANNLSLVTFVNDALVLPCEQRAGNVCIAWQGHEGDSRFTKGVSTFLRSADYPFELGRVEFLRREFDASIVHLRRALELDGDYLPTRLYLGSALVQANRLDEAIAFLELSVKRDPSNVDLNRLLDEARRRVLTPPGN